MARQLPGGGGSRAKGAVQMVKRAWPVVLMAYDRWKALPEEDKERYRRQAREYADRGRKAVDDARKRRGSGPRRPFS